MTKNLSTSAQILAEAFSDKFWELVGNSNFCMDCNAPGVNDPEKGCPAGNDVFCRECYRCEHAENLEDTIRDFAAILCRAVDA